MRKWLKGLCVCLAIILLCSGLGGCALPAWLQTILPASQEASVPSSAPATEPTQPSTEHTEPPITLPPTDETLPPVEQTEPPTETTGPTQPPQTNPPEPWASEAVTVGSYIEGITAKKAFVYDFGTGTYLYMKGEADAKVYPASITKLMNAYTAMKIFDLDDKLTMDRGIWDITPKDTSLAGIYAGNQMTFHNALKAMLIPSGSDAAHLIAVSGGRKLADDPTLDAQAAEDLFVEEMNRQVELLGLASTHFVHADGYQDYYHYTCMADLTIIASAVLNSPTLRDIVKQHTAYIEFTNREPTTLPTTNLMLRPYNSLHYKEETCGLKTGTTTAAGSCLMGLFYTEGRYILIGVFQCDSNSARYRNADTLYYKFVRGETPPVTPPEDPDTTEGTTPPTTESVPPTTESVPPTTESVPPTTESVPPTTESVPPTTESVPPVTESVSPTETS